VGLRERMAASTIEIFTSMVMMEIAIDDEVSQNYGTLLNSITGMVGLTGTTKGVLAIHIPHTVAFAITGNFLGIELEEVNEDVEDAIGELANMVGGNVKSLLSEKGRDIELSLPSTVSGKEYGFQSIKGAEKFIIPFRCDAGVFFVELQLES
jgi:chemotaxis protein CheX